MCWCLVHLKNALKDYAGFSDEENAYMSSLQWDEVEGNFDIKFPRDEPLTYPVPVMGPLKGESPMEPFGRAWEILKYFSSVQGSRWRTRFGTAACMPKAQIVTQINLPKWMRTTFDICLDLLLCEHVSGTDRYRCKLLGPSTKCDFFAYQINGAIGLLIKLLGAIDPAVLLKWASIPVDSAEAIKVKNAAAKLQHLRLHAAICADLTGFGKTKLILLTSLVYSVLADTNRPTLLLVPSALISQWTTEIETNWSYFRPILSYGEVLVNSQP